MGNPNDKNRQGGKPGQQGGLSDTGQQARREDDEGDNAQMNPTKDR